MKTGDRVKITKPGAASFLRGEAKIKTTTGVVVGKGCYSMSVLVLRDGTKTPVKYSKQMWEVYR